MNKRKHTHFNIHIKLQNQLCLYRTMSRVCSHYRDCAASLCTDTEAQSQVIFLHKQNHININLYMCIQLHFLQLHYCAHFKCLNIFHHHTPIPTQTKLLMVDVALPAFATTMTPVLWPNEGYLHGAVQFPGRDTPLNLVNMLQLWPP